MSIKHYSDDKGVERIDIVQTITGGLSLTPENRHLDYEETRVLDKVIGNIVVKTKRCPVDELEQNWLKIGWTPDTIDHGVIYSYDISDTPKSGKDWVDTQVSSLTRLNFASSN